MSLMTWIAPKPSSMRQKKENTQQAEECLSGGIGEEFREAVTRLGKDAPKLKQFAERP